MLCSLALFADSTVQASPIRTRANISAQSSVVGLPGLRAWVNFLNAGQQLWSEVKSPPVTLAVRKIMAQALSQANAASSPWVQYLTWRRDLNPTRFDFYHPFLGPQIENLPPPNPQPQTIDPPPPTVVPPPPGPTVPEPSSWMLSLGVLASGVYWRRRAVKKA
ncbi:PEP-CTERM sorting domain-containing protein [Singulisphaera sp. PoT]|uniref:PEP-CTERM sorting domain-containing protein n=1 Tax=Singulisphaera sp. PoT TaxID=3411797 RepID=UPI003BF5323E